MLDDLPDVLCI